MNNQNTKIRLVPSNAIPTGANTQDKFSDDPLDYARIYADGKLDEELGYDIMSILNGSLEVMQACLCNLAVPAHVDGVDKPCTLYAWHSVHDDNVRMLGFVVFDNDTEAVVRAREYQKKHPAFV